MGSIQQQSATIIECDALIIGAGFSGVSMLYRLRKAGLNSRIFEAATDFGGVWYWNRYPGARVDSEWPMYQLNIPEVHEQWHFKERFPGHEELREYFAHVDSVLDLRKDTTFNARVNSCVWNDEEGKWTVRTGQGHLARCKYLLLCSGLLHREYKPNIPGLPKFHGAVHHSSSWPSDTDCQDKKVGIIGTGATGVQIISSLAKLADQLTVFMRSPSYCFPANQRPIALEESKGWNKYFECLLSSGRKSLAGFPVCGGQPNCVLESSPEEREAYWERTWGEGAFSFLLDNYRDVASNAESNRKVYEFWAKKVRARMTDPKKKDLMAPPVDRMPFYFNTKRPPLEIDFYEMIDKPSVEVIDVNGTPFERFDATGVIMKDGRHIDLDILVLATGFDSFSGSVTNMGLKNRDGMDMQEYWSEGIRSYLGVTFQGFPNAFMVYTPHAPTALANGTTIIEAQADFIMSIIAKMRKENIRTVEATTDAEDSWMNQIDNMNQHTLFPLTDSWWNGANIPGKKVQSLTYLLGIETYEKECNQKLDGWQGFDVRYEKGNKPFTHA